MSIHDLLIKGSFKEGDAKRDSDGSDNFASLLKKKLGAFKAVVEAQGNPDREFIDVDVRVPRSPKIRISYDAAKDGKIRPKRRALLVTRRGRRSSKSA